MRLLFNYENSDEYKELTRSVGKYNKDIKMYQQMIGDTKANLRSVTKDLEEYTEKAEAIINAIKDVETNVRGSFEYVGKGFGYIHFNSNEDMLTFYESIDVTRQTKRNKVVEYSTYTDSDFDGSIDVIFCIYEGEENTIEVFARY